MGLAAQDRADAFNGLGCLGKAKDDEPVFTLRAQDKLMKIALGVWISEANSLLGPEHPKVIEARALFSKMLEWQAVNPTKYPD
jgi:hypothetical protein